jgi:hypothetical protein
MMSVIVVDRFRRKFENEGSLCRQKDEDLFVFQELRIETFVISALQPAQLV